MIAKQEVQLRRYVVRDPKYSDWHVFVIGSDGYFSTTGTFGGYAFWWSHFGERDFRLFLLEVERWYTCSKLSNRDEYQGDQTLKAVKQFIVEHRRNGDLDKDEARDEWQRLEEEFGSLDDVEDFHRWYSESELPKTWPDLYELRCNDFPHEVRAFFDKMFTRFKDVLRAELVAEGLLAQPVSHGA